MEPKVIWSKYKSLELWKRIILIVPFVIVIALAVLWFLFYRKPSDVGKVILDRAKKKTNEIIKESEKKIEKLEKEEKKLEEERKETEERLIENAKESNDIDNRIDTTDDDDVYELERIREEIAERLKNNPA